MKFCQKCGKELMDEAVICVGCGCPVSQTANIQPATPKKFCTHCGKEVPEQATVCMNCGCPVTSAAPNGPTIAKRQYKHNLDAIIYSVLGVLSIVLLLVESFCTLDSQYGLWSESFVGLLCYVHNDLTSIIVFVACCIEVAVMLIFSWIGFGKKRSFAIANIVCSSMLACTVITNSIYGAVNYGYGYYYREFNSFSGLFYVEIVILLALVALSVLNLCGIYLIKMPGSEREMVKS